MAETRPPDDPTPAAGAPAPAGPPAEGGAFARPARLFFAASLAMATGVLLWNAGHPYSAWPNTSDDMFYYLTLARETAEHGVVSVDGVRPTNGFHPLWFLILRALLGWLPPAALPGAGLAVLAMAHAAGSLALWRALRRLAGAATAGLLAGLYAANPFVLRIVFAGVESALAACFVAVALWAHLRWLDGGRRRDRALSLAALVLAVASRTDTVMLAAALAAAAALGRLRGTRRPADAWRAIDRTPVALAALPVLAFGLWSQRATGEFVQTSGRALSYWQSAGDWRIIREALGGLGALATPATAVVYALEVAVQFVGWVTRAPLELLRAHPLGAMLVAGATVAWILRGPGARPELVPGEGRCPDATRRRVAGELVTFQLLLWTFYALLFRHCQIWYWHTSMVAATLLAAMALAPLRGLGRAAAASLAGGRLGRAVPALLLAAAVACSAQSLGPLRPRPGEAPAAVATGTDPLAALPAGARLAAFDTGRLGWEHPHLEVVNLDGLVNNAAYRALRARRIGRYMLEEQIEWLYVRDPVVERFRAFGLDEWLAAAAPAARSADGVALYRLRSPAGDP